MDLGCGEGILYEYFSQKDQISIPSCHSLTNLTKTKGKNKLIKKIHSFDLISLKDFITSADIRKLPLKDNSIDIGIFCLALMGTNYFEFLLEASRCLKMGGFLIIAEVISRMNYADLFCSLIVNLGYAIEEKV